VNEELQSTNEELETSKEELQSTNEELVTVNTELQNKVDELSRANNDINNLLASTRIATLFLDTHLNIKRFTPAATDIFNLIQTDLDRPISDITSKIRYDHLKKDSQEVLDTLRTKEAEIQDADNNWYSMRISPYRTIDNMIDGVVITFVDITKMKRAEESMRDSEANRRLAAVVKDFNDAVTVMDFDGNILNWNKGAENIYGYTEEEALKMNVMDIIPKNKRKETSALIKTLQKQGAESFETQRITKQGKLLNVWLTVTRLVDDDGKPVAIATTERNITECK
jgi:two-component system CheB/CheR fusion protein